MFDKIFGREKKRSKHDRLIDDLADRAEASGATDIRADHIEEHPDTREMNDREADLTFDLGGQEHAIEVEDKDNRGNQHSRKQRNDLQDWENEDALDREFDTVFF
jgi:hypothetical protein